MPDGSVLTVDIANGTQSETFNPATDTWTPAGSTLVPLVSGFEIGGGVLRPDGTVFVTGATGHTSIYDYRTRTWSTGPDFPVLGGTQLNAGDWPGALLPNGNVLVSASTDAQHRAVFEFDGKHLNPIPDAYAQDLLLLPTGQVLNVLNLNSSSAIYMPSGNPDPAWLPTIISVPTTVQSGQTYTITGTQFNGVSQGVNYGDEAQAATNYPLVRITNSATQHVFYCRTHNHSTMGVATGNIPVSTHFDVPLSVESGASILEVVVNGIPSVPVTVIVEPGPNSSQPSIPPGGIAPVGSTSATIQPGEWVSIYGTNLASTTATWTGVFTTSLGGTSVTIDGKPAYLSYVSPVQINLQAPNDMATGPVPVVVTTTHGVATSSVTLAQFAPSPFLLDGKHVAGIIFRTDGSGAYGGGSYDIIGPTGSSLGYATVAAKAGDLIELYGTGFGPTNPTEPPGQSFSGAAPTTNPVRLLINNASVTPSFAGLSGAGLYQINVTVPPGLGAGDVTLVATVDCAQTPAGVLISLQQAGVSEPLVRESRPRILATWGP